MCRNGPAGFLITERVAGMCKSGMLNSLKRLTIVAIRCDTSEETRRQLKERGREKLYPSTAVVTNPNGGRQNMVKVDRSFYTRATLRDVVL
ncbi:hypothetical protein ACO338_003702 [Salmonella enterica]|uniref:hypothetical protein n=1 Tax=Salmonella enterica TaxID=28901 RepID=UPI001271DA1A|nr:hypothetical protein [Salmonella enterica]EBE7962663.1 hypothetical protein [Salmonella enterica subsp. enterica serovar Infantis]EBV2906355.1 hypothetical protein [Salmonella enterica subsp. enterica serovar Mbandaka]EBZ5858828.1 hypothetical protein [Salmonella enterica subsp. enterica serovar Amersfoort]ECC9431868.1 hypothetical protein [Salmonella enterica subsp. enterica]EDR7036595.1 hypothetical protein [Salmonella enterica subsp. enterica serovar Concord]